MILDRFKLEDRVAIVTGGGRGIGESIALTFAEVGADIVVAARTPEQIEGVAEKARSMGRRALAIPCDVSDSAQLEQLVSRTVDEFGRIDLLVNNAGGSPPRPALETSEAMFEKAFRFNVSTAFLLTRLAVPHMRKSDGASVINISSAAGRLIQPGFAAYGTAKAALSFLTKLLGAEFAPEVRVNAIAVGSVGTSALLPFLDDASKQAMEEHTPMKRIGHVEDIALAALYLASSASEWVTGKILEVDGGTEETSWPF